MPKRAIKKTICLPEHVLRELQRRSDAEHTLSGVIQEELRPAKRARLKQELREIQNYWGSKGAPAGSVLGK